MDIFGINNIIMIFSVGAKNINRVMMMGNLSNHCGKLNRRRKRKNNAVYELKQKVSLCLVSQWEHCNGVAGVIDQGSEFHKFPFKNRDGSELGGGGDNTHTSITQSCIICREAIEFSLEKQWEPRVNLHH